MRRRGKPHRIRLFPEDIQIEVNRMILSRGDERKTYGAIVVWLRERGYQTSESAVGRYADHLEKMEREKLLSKKDLEQSRGRLLGKQGRFYELMTEFLDLFESIKKN